MIENGVIFSVEYLIWVYSNCKVGNIVRGSGNKVIWCWDSYVFKVIYNCYRVMVNLWFGCEKYVFLYGFVCNW